jgi:type II secretory pathway pseudopilin PulG
MPLTLRIESELDERSATAAATRAERIYTESAQNMSRELSEGITRGAREGGAAIEKMATDARGAYKRVGDATDELRQQERLLREMREDGARGVEVQAERVRQARKREKDAIKEAASAYDGYERAARTAGQAGERAGISVASGLRTGVTEAVRGATSQFGVLGSVAESTFAGMSGRGAMAAAGVAGIGVAAVAAGKQLYDLGAVWDEIGDSIAIRTGKLGTDLTAMTTMVRDLGSVTAAPLENIGDIAGRVSQSMSLSGNQLSDMTKTLADLQAMTGEQTDIRSLGKTFNLFDVAPSDQIAALDSLFSASQNTGASINELITGMQGAGKTAAEFGLSFGDTAGLLVTLDEAGLDFSKTAPTLSIAMKNLARDGKEPAEGLRQTIDEIKRLSEANLDTQAITLAQETFGRGYADLLNVIKSGKLDVDTLNNALSGMGPTIEQTRDATADWSEEWQKITNNLKSGLAPAAEMVFGQVNHHLDQFGDLMTGSQDLVTGLGNAWTEIAALISGNPIEAQVLITGSSTLDANGNPVATGAPAPGNNPLDAITGAAGAPGGPKSLEELLGIAPAGGGAPLPLPSSNRPGGPGVSPYKDWYGDGSTSAASESLPDAPSLPLQYTSTAGMPTAIANAQTRLDEAVHAAAEKQARVNQLRQSNLATEEDIQKAANDLTKAEKDRQQAEQALHDSKMSALEKQTQDMGQMSSSMGEIGAALDKDLGISDGLSGIADNLVRFVASLAMAPMVGQLSAIAGANPNEGSGMMGMLAANGSFGQQYTPGYIGAQGASASSMGPTALQPGYSAGFGGNVDSAIALAQSADGKPYTYGGSDLVNGLADCSGAISDLYEVITTGQSNSGRSFTTESDFGALGFKPGYMPGALNIGVHNGGGGKNSHMASTLPNGVNFESGGGGIQYGGGAAGALDSQFENQYYLPVGAASPSLYSPANTNPALTGGGGWAGPTGVPAGITGGAGESPVWGASPGMPIGTGAGVAAPGMGIGVGSAAGQPLGGQSYPAGPSGGGVGMGGMAMDAAMLATSGLDMMAPGAGAAAKVGIQVANRTAKYAGQVAGIGVSGLLDTITPAGDNPKASIGNSWLGKIAGGIAGAAPALPNMSGGKKPPGPMEGGAAGGAAGQGGNTINQTLNQTNNRVTEDFAGGSAVREMGAMHGQPGRN